ncbi:MAG: hypothetical protein Ct9H90mP27_7720 [Gammaproteobacteria bacterium]|nr:MAG: hypothetical protein Ct9H90mP27_7720 [Gammaproteobacteria bacterium]
MGKDVRKVEDALMKFVLMNLNSTLTIGSFCRGDIPV